jgi:hypothetical protein
LIAGVRAGALAMALLLPSFLAAQNTPPAPTPTYTTSEIDTKLDAIAKEIKSLHDNTYSKTELDAKLDVIRAELKLQSVYAKTEVDSRLDTLTSKVNLIPWWLPVLVAGLSFLVSAGTLLRSIWTRAEDRLELRKTAAYTLIDQFKEREELAASVRGILDNPALLNDQEYGQVYKLQLVRLGNWFDTMATRWKNKEADAQTLEAGDMRKLARNFWSQFQQARKTLANDPYLEQLQPEWPNLEWLCSQN